jgi:hypothetical protein
MKILPVFVGHVRRVWCTTQAVQNHCYSFVAIVEVEDSRKGVVRGVQRYRLVAGAQCDEQVKQRNSRWQQASAEEQRVAAPID